VGGERELCADLPEGYELVPSTSAKQHRFMEAVAHDPGFAKKAGVSSKVGKDFAAADDAAGITKDKRAAHMAKRKGAGLSHRAVAAEFGVSKSTAHRHVTKATMGRGYTKGGKA